MPDVSAWKQDAQGWYLEMFAGARKDYSIDATELSGGQDIASASPGFPAGVELVGMPELNGKTVKFWLLAVSAGVHACSFTILGTGDPAYNEIFPFRVVVK